MDKAIEAAARKRVGKSHYAAIELYEKILNADKPMRICIARIGKPSILIDVSPYPNKHLPQTSGGDDAK